MNDSTTLFTLSTPLGFVVRTTQRYWQKTVAKHPDIVNMLSRLQNAITTPVEVRESSRDKNILLFYGQKEKYWIVAVVRRLNGDGFLVTAYRTDAIKEGTTIWPK